MLHVWRISIRAQESFASLVRHDLKSYGQRCEQCGRITAYQHHQQIVEWEEGSDVVADFVNVLGLIIVREPIAATLVSRFRGWTKYPIELFDAPRLHRPARVTKRTKKRVWMPYEGPPLVELFVTHEVSLLPQSTVRFEKECAVCGGRTYVRNGFEGVEHRQGSKHNARLVGNGLFVAHDELKGCDVFRPRSTGLTLCTDAVRDFIVAERYSNVEFFEYGDVI